MATVLLIEDELFIRDLYTKILEEAGLKVLAAQDGEEGINLSLEKPDLILLDIMLPKLNGIEVLGRLKSEPTTQKIPVILVTNLGQEEIIKKAFNLGAQGYLLKMRTEPKYLTETVNHMLQNPTFTMDINNITFD